MVVRYSARAEVGFRFTLATARRGLPVPPRRDIDRSASDTMPYAQTPKPRAEVMTNKSGNARRLYVSRDAPGLW